MFLKWFCYKTPLPKLIRFAFKTYYKRFLSSQLVNLVANKDVVQELFADRFKVKNIANELYRILPGQPYRETMLAEYKQMRDKLGDHIAPDNAANLMVYLLKK